jgi:uncharacterized protein
MRCPTCDRVFQPEMSPAMPFCCEQCRLIDLGRWLEEKQGLPFEQAERDEEVDRGPSREAMESAD